MRDSERHLISELVLIVKSVVVFVQLPMTTGSQSAAGAGEPPEIQQQQPESTHNDDDDVTDDVIVDVKDDSDSS